MTLIYLGCAWLAGIFLGSLLHLPPPFVGLLASLPLATLLLWRKEQRIRLISACLLLLLLGILYSNVKAPLRSFDEGHIAYYNDQGWVKIEGTVSGEPDVRDTYTNLRVEVSKIEVKGQKREATGTVLVRAPRYPERDYGDELEIEGLLETPPELEGFSYREYLARQGIYSMLRRAQIVLINRGQGSVFRRTLLSFKRRAQRVIALILHEPQAALLTGILLGVETGIPADLMEAFSATGTTHIIAISGFNIAILAGLITSLLNRALGTKWGTLAAILTIGVYTILVGADAAVVRAAIMGIAGAMGTLIGRRQNGLNTLGLAAFVMCIFNPNMPWDISFQLSFFATLGLVIYAPPLQARFLDFLSRYVPEDTAQRLAGPISEYLISTLVAQALVLPLLAYHFGNFSPLFLLANPLILPPQPLVMILGGIALLGGLLNPALGKALAYLAWPFAAYTNRMVTWLATLPAGKLSISTFSFLWVVLYYLLFFTLTFAKDRKALFKQFLKPATLLLALGCIALIVWSTAFSAPDGRLTLTLLPDTNSPVLLVETPQGRTILLNGGVRASALNQALGQSLPFGHRQIDVLVIPSCRRDDVIGLGGLPDRVEIKQALWICDPETIQTTRQLYLLLDENDAQQSMFEENAWLDLGNGAKLTMLAVDTNASYLTLEQENFRALLAFGKPETHPWETQTPLSLLVLPGNTKADNIHQADLNHLQVQLVFLPVDAQTLPLSGGLALAELFDDLPLYRTDLFGWLKLSTDAQQLWFNAHYSH